MIDADEDRLYEAAVQLARAEAERDSDGEGVAAAALTKGGHVLTGVWVDAMVDGACLCAETGPICEAHRTGDAIVASICVRWTKSVGAEVLAACGVCQERLVMFGRNVEIGVGLGDQQGFRFVPLSDLRPSPSWDAIE